MAPLFHGIEPAAVSSAIPRLRLLDFPAGHTVFSQGAPGDCLYVIAAGKVKIEHRSAARQHIHLLAVVGPSEMFGELAVFDPGPRSCGAVTVTEVRAVSMDPSALRTWMAEHPAIAEQLLRALSRRVRRTNDALADHVLADGPSRLATQLLLLAQRFGSQQSGGLRVTHDLNQEELGQLVGASRTTVNRMLAEFVNRRWITLGYKAFTILDCERLRRRAGQPTAGPR